MARDATNYFPDGVSATKLRKIADLLGYKSVKDWRDIKGQIGSYVWYEREGYKSWTGVELSIHQDEEGLSAHSRSRYGGSYWDLRKMNETMRVYRDFAGGYFVSDEGRNKFFPSDCERVSPIASGCYIARWRLQNAVSLAGIYRSARDFKGNMALDGPNEIPFLDGLNPLLFSNNVQLPYLIAVWEDYFRSLFVAALQQEGISDRVRSNLNPAKTRFSVEAGRSAEEIAANQFSFQRPEVISRNFKLLDKSLDFETCWKQSSKGKRILLFDQITQLVDDRNAFVHEGAMNMTLYNTKLEHSVRRLLKAADLAHEKMGKHFSFEPITYY
ncbi:hypothetical protein [Rhodovulum sulfidophilum]|uniref:hypothetical protein n=1 Tax=Rhodovulum sulfidophilum TaxID=35806 RepID=UPI00138A0842|nr:hypothetical protein [Rhodovulum sulfidophilum]NDK36856.1 hypothetical protein [Rhodovulum sulfidophilum]